MAQFSWKYTHHKYFRPRRKKVYTTLGLTLLSLSILGSFAIRPTIATIFELRHKLAEQKDICNRLDQKLKSLSLAQTELRRIESDLPIINKYLPQGENYAHLLEEIHYTNEKNDLRLEYIFFHNETETEIKTTNQILTMRLIPFQVRSEGKFSNFLDFLKNFQSTPRSLNPQEIRINSQQQGGSEVYDIKAEAYYCTND